MGKKIMSWKTKGMNKDLSVSAFNPEFSFENMNLRLSTVEGNTAMSWVTEKGTSQVTLISTADGTFTTYLPGNPIGQAVIGNKLVIFTADINTTNKIFIIEKYPYDQDVFQYTLYYEGNLGLYSSTPLETLVSYESDSIQKVYWLGSSRQPRVLNICKSAKASANNTQFDFLPSLQLQEDISVSKIIGGSGKFTAGVIQYAFTYYNENGQETNIFYNSPLRYISPKDRGGAPNETIDNAFQITISNPDRNFDYLRIYSIHRTSLNAVPNCKRVVDIYMNDFNGDITYLDTGTTGDTIDPSEILYKNRRAIMAETMEQKDGTLFLGNISYIKSKSIYKTIEDSYDTTNHKIKVTYSSDGGSDRVRLKLEDNILMGTTVFDSTTGKYIYENQLSLENNSGEVGSVCAGFKGGNTYRLGLQFQDKTGAWTGAIFLDDYTIPSDEHCTAAMQYNNKIYYYFPRIEATIKKNLTKDLRDDGYVSVRPLIVLPEIHDRGVVCQTAVCPTMCTTKDRATDKKILGQSSWFWRPNLYAYTEPTGATYYAPYMEEVPEDGDHVRDYRKSTLAAPYSSQGWRNYKRYLPYVEDVSPDIFQSPWNYRNILNDGWPINIREVEVQGYFAFENRFIVDWRLLTMHSPDIEFGDSFGIPFDYYNFENHNYQYVGYSQMSKTFSDIDIQTETPVVYADSQGFHHEMPKSNIGPYGIIAGLFYEDFCVDDTTSTTIVGWSAQKSPYKWLVYPWQGDGSINNDMNRTSDAGVQSSILKKKIISNLRYGEPNIWLSSNTTPTIPAAHAFLASPQLFKREDGSTIKTTSCDHNHTNFDATLYLGDIDTVINPDKPGPVLFSYGSATYSDITASDISTEFDCFNWYRLGVISSNHGIFQWRSNGATPPANWRWYDPSSPGSNIGDYIQSISQKKASVRMKYKSTSHLIASTQELITLVATPNNTFVTPILEIQQTLNPDTIFGGRSIDALKSNVWIIAGKAKPLGNDPDDDPTHPRTKVNFNYGDTYYQRYDCLKTYPYTSEDKNQIVEIGSFMLETYLNIDGRYDKNRGQHSNLYMTPENFNLINPVYNQRDNFFSFKLEEEPATGTDTSSVTVKFPNEITWSAQKENGEDVDSWTNFTLANILELDGDKGAITSIQRYNNQLIAFQEKAVSQILYNEQAQISTTTGVPIEMGTSGKVDGSRYLNINLGCHNKWSICNTPAGIYFMDNINKGIYLFNGQFTDISLTGGFDSWCKRHLLDATNENVVWNPTFTNYQVDDSAFVAYYDKINKEVLFINNNVALAWSEKFGTFTSFYNYEEKPYFIDFNGLRLWAANTQSNGTELWKHNVGGYCNFFGTIKPYYTTLVGNPDPQIDKTFTNLEFRANVDGDGEYNDITDKFTPTLPFDALETWNEYQHGQLLLQNKNGHALSLHNNSDGTASLKRKFRIWRCDIPRDNAPLTADEDLNISRIAPHPLDRMRNHWLYLKLSKSPSTFRTNYTTTKQTYRPSTTNNYNMYVIPLSFFEHLFEIGAANIILNATATWSNHLSWCPLDYNLNWIEIQAANYYLTTPKTITPELIDTWKSQASAMQQTIYYIGISTYLPDGAYVYVDATYTNRTEIHDLTMTYFD